ERVSQQRDRNLIEERVQTFYRATSIHISNSPATTGSLDPGSHTQTGFICFFMIGAFCARALVLPRCARLGADRFLLDSIRRQGLKARSAPKALWPQRRLQSQERPFRLQQASI